MCFRRGGAVPIWSSGYLVIWLSGRLVIDHLGADAVAMAFRPANVAFPSSSSSMRRSWLYLQTRSVRLADPVLIWPTLVATARSAIVVSSVSPERCEMTLA